VLRRRRHLVPFSGNGGTAPSFSIISRASQKEGVSFPILLGRATLRDCHRYAVTLSRAGPSHQACGTDLSHCLVRTVQPLVPQELAAQDSSRVLQCRVPESPSTYASVISLPVQMFRFLEITSVALLSSHLVNIGGLPWQDIGQHREAATLASTWQCNLKHKAWESACWPGETNPRLPPITSQQSK